MIAVVWSPQMVTLSSPKYAECCSGRDALDAWRSRREGLAETIGYGAVETGEHVFYERQGDGEERLVGRARFAQMWKLEGDVWKLARVFSYDHAPLRQVRGDGNSGLRKCLPRVGLRLWLPAEMQTFRPIKDKQFSGSSKSAHLCLSSLRRVDARSSTTGSDSFRSVRESASWYRGWPRVSVRLSGKLPARRFKPQ